MRSVRPTCDDPLRLSGIFQQRYEVVRCVKAGGMGAVYEVIHLETRRRCALKVMLPSVVADPEMRVRFRREATVTAEIDSEHIVMVFDAGVDLDTGAPFIVMELLKGEELGVMLTRRRNISTQEVVELIAQLACALEKTHAAGIVHRDLKPANLFVTRRDDGSVRLKVLDFGIAKVLDAGAEAGQTRAMMGTPFYMAPEQISSRTPIGPAADLYAMGHIAFALLAGEPYWRQDRSPEGVYPLLVKVMGGAQESATERAARRGVELPVAFDSWFARAVAVAPEHRFAGANDLAVALAEALASVRAGGAARYPAQSSPADEATLWIPDEAPVLPNLDGATTTKAAQNGSHSITAAIHTQAPSRRSGPTVWATLVTAVVAVAIAAGWALRQDGSSSPRVQDDGVRPGSQMPSFPSPNTSTSSQVSDPPPVSAATPPPRASASAPAINPSASSGKPTSPYAPLRKDGAKVPKSTPGRSLE